MEKGEMLLEKTGRKQPDTAKAKPSGLAGADGLRAIACLSVIVHHFSQRIAMQVQPLPVRELQAFLLLGSAGVSVFFVLSGFLLSYPFWRQYLGEGAFPDIGKYAVRRAARIVPGYYASLIVCTLIVVLFHIPSEALWTRFLGGLTFTAGFHYITMFPNEINGPFWSISFEVFCYLLMPVFMFGMFKLLGKKRSFARSMIYWMAVFAFIAFLNQLVHVFFTPDNVRRGWEFGIVGGAKYWMPNYNPIGFFGHFCMGIFAAGITARLFRKAEGYARFKKANGFDIIGAACFLGSIALLWGVRHAPEFSFSMQSQPYFFPAYAMLIAGVLAVTPHSNWFGSLLDNRFFKFTAKVSFGLYIWHNLVIFIVASLWIKDYQVMGMNDLKVWGGVSLIILLASYILSVLSFRFIEKPVLDRTHK